MTRPSRIIAWSAYVALACSGMLASTGCQSGDKEQLASNVVAIEIRFHSGAVAPPPSAGLLPLGLEAPDPTRFDDIARILVDITYADSGQPFYPNFELVEVTPNVWRGDVPLLPRNQQLRFAARALDATGAVAFSGETLATLTIDNQSVSIPLAPAQDDQTFQMPRMFRIVYPAEMYAGHEEQVIFTIEGNAGAAIGYRIAAAASPSTPAAAFAPATGTVTLTNTVADFMAVYAPPEVSADTDFEYQVTITAAGAQSAVAITTNFKTKIKPRPPGGPIVGGTQPGVLFNPVILSLTANGSETPGTVKLIAAVSDDGGPAGLSYQWSYTPAPSTPDATFAGNGQGNPGLFQGYTVAHRGTITLAVTDADNGTTTLHYQLNPYQFADAIDHTSASRLRHIVAGAAHTCVLADQGRVHCWGDNQYGQLGYGNTTDIGDAPDRLPYDAGDVPLPVTDPVMQLVAGNHHTCALLQSGLVYCWGRNNHGQLGYNRTDSLGDGEPVTSFGYVGIGDLATRIAAGGDHTCAILKSGALRCWGYNLYGQLGRGNTEDIGDNEAVYSAGNVDLGASVTVKDLALGGYHTCALVTTGTVRCWGRNDHGQLGYGSTANLGDNEPLSDLPDVSLTGTVRKLDAGENHTCALTAAGTLRCWGHGAHDQLGQSFGGADSDWGNAANELPGNLPSDVNTGAKVTDVTAGGNHTCALSSDGQLKCWGLGTSGQLGYGNFSNQPAPPAAGVDLDGVSAYRITAGAAHTCALRNNGTARCWGAGADGRLGRGSTASSPTATGDVDVQIFACGNGIQAPDEACDDGNSVNGDGCDNNCTLTACGNGIVTSGEACDDGNLTNGDGCESNCSLTAYTLSVSRAGSGAGSVTSSPAGISCGSDCSESYGSGTAVTLTAAPAASSTFSGWSGGGCSGTGSCTVTMTATTSVTASFSLAALAPPSCRALHAASPTLPSGTYEIDPDGSGGDPPVTVACDMTTDGGGWTIVFVAPSANVVALPLAYTAGTPRLLADAELALLAFRDAALAVAPNHARFPFPAPWRTQPPFNVDGESLMVPVSIDGGAAVVSELRYGKYTFSSRCEHDWVPQLGLWGRICIVGRPAPFYAGFSTPVGDHCSSSLEVYSSVPCSDARRFSIAVR